MVELGIEEGGEKQKEEDEISVSVVKKAIKKLKKRKSAGPDGIPNEAWIYGRDQLCGVLTRVLNKIWRGKGYPEGWRLGKVKPVYKKGDRKAARNYRPVTLMDTGYKLYAEILRARMAKKLESTGGFKGK